MICAEIISMCAKVCQAGAAAGPGCIRYLGEPDALVRLAADK
jgi:hypothetical protein